MSANAESDSIRLLAGLGNPGPRYGDTRHNIGFMILDRLAREAGADWAREKKWECEVSRQGDAVLVKPQTFMNLSGRSLQAVSRFYRIAPEQICVVYDDVDLELGTIRFRAGGSAGGHNGIKSTIQCLGTQEFPRLKVGVGRGDSRVDTADYVLSPFRPDEAETLDRVLDESVVALQCLLREGLTEAMNRYNRKPKPEKKPARAKPDAKANPGVAAGETPEGAEPGLGSETENLGK